MDPIIAFDIATRTLATAIQARKALVASAKLRADEQAAYFHATELQRESEALIIMLRIQSTATISIAQDAVAQPVTQTNDTKPCEQTPL